MKLVYFALGTCIGALIGACVGWLIVRTFMGSHALSNPDLPGGMAWMFLICCSGFGLIAGGTTGLLKGIAVARGRQSESDSLTGRDGSQMK